jgi:hypothetical protein
LDAVWSGVEVGTDELKDSAGLRQDGWSRAWGFESGADAFDAWSED